jgi:uncharacterized protein (DUF2235 family)
LKRIVICADGTWNSRDQLDRRSGKRRPTNVTKVARAIRPRSADGIDQVVCYHPGIGTGGPLDRWSGGAFGRGLEENVRTLYRFIVYNFVPGDELYFFGFSRGAFTVRTLAGFLRRIGLVEKDDDFFVPELYGCYERGQGEGTPGWIAAHLRIRDKRPCPQIRFVGVWDTVGALGAPGFLGQLFAPYKYAYHDVGLHPAIEHAYHALAIDEQRRPFAPALWQRPLGWEGQLEQSWFAGAHSDVGGGCAPDGLANEALHWMVEKAEKLGLEFDRDYLDHFWPCFDADLHDSMTWTYRLLGRHVRALGRAGEHGQLLHQSAADRCAMVDSYRPANLLAYLSDPAVGAHAQTTRARRRRISGMYLD